MKRIFLTFLLMLFSTGAIAETQSGFIYAIKKVAPEQFDFNVIDAKIDNGWFRVETDGTEDEIDYMSRAVCHFIFNQPDFPQRFNFDNFMAVSKDKRVFRQNCIDGYSEWSNYYKGSL